MKKVHFIGIGGIGMSALARFYKHAGFSVSGSDNNSSEVTEGLEKEGITVYIGSNSKNIPEEVDKIIFTIAVNEENEELKKARILSREKGVSVLTYPEALGEVTRNKKVISVCGTHGKTTTTAMAYQALKHSGFDLSMILGSMIVIDGKKTNYAPSVSKDCEWIVIESCEYRKSFLNYFPDITLVTNIDNDHLDFYGNLENIKKAFQEFTENIKPGGSLIIHSEEDFLKFENKINADGIISSEEIILSVPGVHNRKNAQLVVALGGVLKINRNKILEGLKTFTGTWRRQEYKGNFKTIEFYDDYAHHPTEIKATISAFREKFPNKKIGVLFMPHLYSRTKLLLSDFANSFGQANKVYVLPIYAAREKEDKEINSDILVSEINKISQNAIILESLDGFMGLFNNNKLECEVIISMGAGNVNDIYKKLK